MSTTTTSTYLTSRDPVPRLNLTLPITPKGSSSSSSSRVRDNSSVCNARIESGSEGHRRPSEERHPDLPTTTVADQAHAASRGVPPITPLVTRARAASERSRSPFIFPKMTTSPLTSPVSPVSPGFPTSTARRQRTFSCLSTASTSSQISAKLTLDLVKPGTPTQEVTISKSSSMASFTPSPSARLSLRALRSPSSSPQQQRPSPPERTTTATVRPARSPSSASIPSISRSHSSSFSTPAPPTPSSPHPSAGGPLKLDPLFAALENASRLRSRAGCVVCGKDGSDFPRCGRCGDAWCSRECRVRGLKGAKRHTCSATKIVV